eukprot:tig00020964_g16799.t1
MYGLAKNFYNWIKKKRERRINIILIGLDGAGKTTILKALKGEIAQFVAPTVGFNTEEVRNGNYVVKIFDVGGGPRIRSIWNSYYAEVHGAIYVVDSADVARLEDSKSALFNSLKEPLLAGKPILIFANKQDLPARLSPADVAVKMSLAEIKQSRYNIKACVALTKEGQQIDENVKLGEPRAPRPPSFLSLSLALLWAEPSLTVWRPLCIGLPNNPGRANEI